MMNAEIVLKSTGAVTEVSGDVVDLNAPSIVRLDLARADVVAMEREGSDLVMRLANGEQIRVADFYPNGATAAPNDIVLRESDGTLWQARPGTGLPRFSLLQDLDDLLVAQAAGGGSSLALPAAILGGLGAAGAVAAAAGGGGGNDDNTGTGGTTPGQPAPGTGGTTPDRDAPAAPSVTVGGDGAQITGRGEAGATVQVRDASGAVIGTSVVAADGGYTVTLSPPRTAGGSLVVTQTDPAGNVSAGTSAQAPDLTAPAAPSAEIGATGSSVTGRGEAGATVTIRDASGVVVGSTIVGADGTYTVTLSPAQANGGTLSVSQSDAAGNISPATTFPAPDITAPAAPTAAISADGSSVSGNGEAGARVTVTDAAGTVIGTATVSADGSYAAPLTTAQANGGTVTVAQTDAAGNASPGVTVTAPDLTAPAAPGATLDATGSIVTGIGEPGARISVRDADGTEIGTATVDARGGYSVVLSTPQIDSQSLVVTQADAAGNVSPATPLTAPDITPPAAPTAAVAADGASIAGTGEAGATITIRSPVGAVIGSAVVGQDGSYAAVLSPAQVDGELLSVRQSDPAGNVSPPASAAAPDLVAGVGPDAPTAVVGADGATVSGTALAGATVTLYDADGVVIGTGTATADGAYGIALAPPRIDGETIRATQTDGNGAVSPPATAIAPDLTAPDAPVAVIDATGSAVTGLGQPGALVTVRAADGTVIGTATAGGNGAFAVALAPAQTDGAAVAVTQADASGNVSAPLTLVSPDFAAPPAPSAVVSADGSAVTGRGEAGTSVVVRDDVGGVLGTGTVAADGTYSVQITPAQANGETLSVTLSDTIGNTSPPTPASAPDITAPAAPVAQIASDGSTVTGTGEAGATVTVRDATDTVIGTANVAADGSYTVTLASAQTNGEALSVSQVDAAGNPSTASGVTAPDSTAPGQPTAAIAADGLGISGTGEPGASIAVTGTAGAIIATAIVAADGSYSALLIPAQANGETLRIVQTDASGNASMPLALNAPDITAPPAPAALLDPSGAVVTGTGEVGALVTVSVGAGTILGTAVVTAQGNYSVTLSTPQINSQALSVTQRDVAGNLSPVTGLTGPDLTAPGAPNVLIGADGATLTGGGEPGATVFVRDPLGIVLGTAIVNPDGSYAVVLVPAQTDGEVLGVRQTDASGNVSPEATVTAPDLVANIVPDAPSAAVGADGASVAGVAIGDAVITVYDAVGTVIGTGVANPDGSYAVALVPARIDGEIVRVTQTEADGDVSPPATATAPDMTAPAVPTATLDNTGGVVTGTGETGATIVIRGADAAILGTATVSPNGAYAATLSTAQVNGEILSVVQIDAASNVSASISVLAPDFTAPDAPIAQIAGDGSAVTGTGEAGATITVRDAANTVIGTATVAIDGSFTAPLTPAQANGGTVTVVQADAVGNVSPTVPLSAPDVTAPPAPVAQITADGITVTGAGEVGASVTVTAGAVTVTTQVGADGSFSATLSPAPVNGESINVVQTDAAGNASLPATVLAPDLVVPAAPTATVAGDGASVVGAGEAGARIVVTDAAGGVVGIAIVAIDGSYSVPLAPPLLNGERLNATQTDGGGNISPPVIAVAPDITAPIAPTLTIATDGASASGVGEGGATVTLRNPDGSVIGVVQAAADGSFSFALAPPRLDGEVLSVTQSDAIGNVSPVAFDVAPDTTAPSVPTATIDANGTNVRGIGEAGATVTVTGPGNTPLGTAVVAADGSYTVVLNSVQGNGQALLVSQSDPSGNASPSTPVTAPDFTFPTAPTAVVAVDGGSVNGLGEPGATVTIVDSSGVPLGTALVAGDGNYTATLSTPQTNGELLSASQRDPGGNLSPVTSVLAPDTTAPSAPVATVSADGAFVTGSGEPGARVTVTGTDGNELGTAVVTAGGAYAVQLTPAQTDGETLAVTLTDQAGNVSPPASPIAPDGTAPLAPTAAITVDGSAAFGSGVAGSTITVTNAANTVLGTTIVDADGSYSVPLVPAQRNGEILGVVQADTAGNVSPPIPAVAPDLTPPAAPIAAVNSEGTAVTGTGERGAIITITTAAGVVLGTASVGPTGAYVVTLNTPQRNGETLVATQSDVAGNASGGTAAVAPDLTAPPPPTVTVIAGDGSGLTGSGEPGARVEVRAPDTTLLGTTTVNPDGSFTVGLSPAQTAGATLSVTQADAAGNLSLPSTIVAPFDISAFDNVDTAAIDLLPATTAVNLGQAAYVALVALNVVNLQAEVLTTGNVRFSVQEGHSLDATFTFDTLLDLTVAGSYAVVVQRFENGQWVAVSGNGAASLLDIGILNGNLVATDTLGPGEYRAFVTAQGGGAGVALLSSLSVTGVDSDFTNVAGITPVAATGNVITEAGPGGDLDIVGPGTRVFSVTVNGVTTAVAPGGSTVTGLWGTLTINGDGSYTYVPTATTAPIGQTEIFTYTLIDPTDGEFASASLSIAIGSPDITGAPVAVADQAFADVTFQNVVATVAPAQAFAFNAGLTGSGNGSFAVAPNAVGDITIIANRQAGLGISVLPQYTVTIRDAGLNVVRTASAVAVANDLLGTSSFTFDDLPSGNYTYTVASRSVTLGSFTTAVSIGSTTTFLDQHTLASAETATGNLLDNDSINTSFATIRVNAGSGFAEIGAAPVTLTGAHGTLTVDETGGYVYHPSAALGYSTFDLTDTFTYQVVQPNGAFSSATLTVTIDVPADSNAGAAGVLSVMSSAHFVGGDDGTIPLDALTLHTGESAVVTPEGAAIGLAAYDLFEGRGELEDVLSHYLSDQQSGGSTDTAETVHPVPVELSTVPPVADPLSFLATSPDQDHLGTVASHVV